MTPLQTLGFALGAAFASGLNLYATVAVLGLLHRYEIIQLPSSLSALAHPIVLVIALALYAVEFIADKVPYIDNAWDVVHTFIRPPAAALLAYSAFGSVPESWRVAAGLLAGSVALTSHGTKATTRAATNASPEPVSNSALSIAEDGIAVSLAWMAATHPFLTLGLVAVLVAVSVYILVKLFGYVRKMLRRVSLRTSWLRGSGTVPDASAVDSYHLPRQGS
jgi:Domain of unknown function (DUF4126)